MPIDFSASAIDHTVAAALSASAALTQGEGREGEPGSGHGPASKSGSSTRQLLLHTLEESLRSMEAAVGVVRHAGTGDGGAGGFSDPGGELATLSRVTERTEDDEDDEEEEEGDTDYGSGGDTDDLEHAYDHLDDGIYDDYD